MIKKEIKENLKEFKKQVEENANEIQILETIKPSVPRQNNLLLDQDLIQENVNLYTKEKTFDFYLENGPFKSSYTQNGSHILIHGINGYLSSFNSQNFSLSFETNLEDKIYDSTFLHNELYMATAQNDCVFIYDNTGRELHAVRDFNNPRMIEFLPYHFLLSGTNEKGFLNYFDTSIGVMVSTVFIKDKSPTRLKVNPTNGIVHLGHKNGQVSLYSPAQKEYLMKISCHTTAISTLEIDKSGINLITTGSDNKLKIFDIRNTYKPIKTIKTKTNIHFTSISERNLLAIGYSDKITVLKNFDEIYTSYIANDKISSLKFCPHEDILLIGHKKGVSSIVVPGSGDPIYDSKELSPFMNKKHRQEHEVKRLLEKIPYDMIAINPILGEFENINKNTFPERYMRYYDKDDNQNALTRFYKKR